MIFNFFFGNHTSVLVKAMADLMQPIQAGLEEAGHHVMGAGVRMLPAPVINVLVEPFPEDAFVDALLGMKGEAGDRLLFGLICVEDLQEAAVLDNPEQPRRRANLNRVLARADFVWTLAPQVELYAGLCDTANVGLIEFGFSERLLCPRLIANPALRDLDALMYGDISDRRRTVVERAQSSGLECFQTERKFLPDFVTSDLARRAKVMIDMPRYDSGRYPTPTRIGRALHHGVALVSERLPDNGIAGLHSYSAALCAADEIADRCVALIRAGNYAELGLAALARFRAETSMRNNMARAAQLPFLARIAAARRG